MAKDVAWGRWEDRSRALAHHPLNRDGNRVIREAWVNLVYSVQVSVEPSDWGNIYHLWVRRHDKRPPVWSDMQRIKNEIVGAEMVGVEVYPAQSTVIDQAPMYHIWCLPMSVTLPFGLHVK